MSKSKQGFRRLQLWQPIAKRLAKTHCWRNWNKQELAALENQQASAAVAATMGKAKLCGMLVERKETGKPGDFDNMSIEELRAFLKEDKKEHPGNDTVN